MHQNRKSWRRAVQYGSQSGPAPGIATARCPEKPHGATCDLLQKHTGTESPRQASVLAGLSVNWGSQRYVVNCIQLV
jgi:hypothetical protein